MNFEAELQELIQAALEAGVKNETIATALSGAAAAFAGEADEEDEEDEEGEK